MLPWQLHKKWSASKLHMQQTSNTVLNVNFFVVVVVVKLNSLFNFEKYFFTILFQLT